MTIKSDAFEQLSAHHDETGEVMSGKAIAEMFDTTQSYAYELIAKWKKTFDEPQEAAAAGKTVKKDFKDDSASISVKSLTIKSLDDALRESDVDLDIWEVDRYVINSWQTPMKITEKTMDAFRRDKVEFFVETVDAPKGTTTRNKPIKLQNAKTDSAHTETPVQVTNFQVKVWLKRKSPEAFDKVVEGLIESIPTLNLPSIIAHPWPDGDDDVALEIALYDAHFGKFAWHPETMMGNWDINICTDAYLDGCERGLSHGAPYSPSKIYFVLGQDFMHVDNSFFKTPHGGHTLDADGRFPKIARKAMETVIKAIAMCRNVAPVEVKWVPGNHDLHASFWLSLILEQAFKDDKFVTVDNSPAQRKATLWGNLLVGWWHDASGRKMPASVNALAQWWPDEWGKSKYRELHIGHKHKKMHTKTMPIETVGGVLIRQIPSLSSIDFWHQDSLFVDAIPASETMLWSKNDGVFGNFTINVKPEVD